MQPAVTFDEVQPEDQEATPSTLEVVTRQDAVLANLARVELAKKLGAPIPKPLKKANHLLPDQWVFQQ